MQILRSSIAAALLLSVSAVLGAEEKAAKVSHGVKEAELATVVLAPEAEQRLGIMVKAVESRAVALHRTVPGEVIIPSRSESGQSIFSVLPSLTPTDLIRIAEAQVDADGQVDAARVSHEGARVALERAEQLLKSKAGSERAVDEARVAVSQAEASMRTARARRALLSAPVLASTTPEEIWIRASVYVGELERLQLSVDAKVGALTDHRSGASVPAKPVAGPPSANAAASTVDLFYEASNVAGKFRLGQRVAVAIPLRDTAPALLVPASALVYDIHGGAWVYERIAPHTFARRRVEVRSWVDGEAVLERGPAATASVVTVGVAELFGTEFGVGK
jgi:hypothetical protein